MSGIDAPDNRPALAWVLGLPKGWTTFAERCLLLVLATDSHDGYTCSPTREDVMTAAGMWGSQYYPALKSLSEPKGDRPALLAVEPHGRYRRNTYRFLRSPESATTDRSPESATPETTPARSPESATPDRSPEQESRAGVQSRSPESATHTLPLPTLREGEREGGALDAPAPDGADTPRLSVAEVRDIVSYIVPATAMGTGIRCDNPDLANALAAAADRGWTLDSMTAALADMPTPKSSPTGLLIKRLKALADTDPAAVALPATEQTSAQTRPVADPLAEENQTEVAKFCKWSGADRGALSKTLAAIAAQGYTIDPTLAVDNYSQVNIEHPDLGDDWCVYWEAFQGDEMGEHVQHNEIRATFRYSTGLTDAERMALWNLQQGNREERGDIVCDRPTIAALREFVDVTGPIALAAYQRATQTAPTPVKATHTPRPAEQVLAGDKRDPGPDGFGHVDPPNRTKARPAGHDQAVREADEAERRRQAEALASIDPEQLAAIIALQNGNGEASA